MSSVSKIHIFFTGKYIITRIDFHWLSIALSGIRARRQELKIMSLFQSDGNYQVHSSAQSGILNGLCRSPERRHMMHELTIRQFPTKWGCFPCIWGVRVYMCVHEFHGKHCGERLLSVGPKACLKTENGTFRSWKVGNKMFLRGNRLWVWAMALGLLSLEMRGYAF